VQASPQGADPEAAPENKVDLCAAQIHIYNAVERLRKLPVPRRVLNRFKQLLAGASMPYTN
jgi:hypothetical protein